MSKIDKLMADIRADRTTADQLQVEDVAQRWNDLRAELQAWQEPTDDDGCIRIAEQAVDAFGPTLALARNAAMLCDRLHRRLLARKSENDALLELVHKQHDEIADLLEQVAELKRKE